MPPPQCQPCASWHKVLRVLPVLWMHLTEKWEPVLLPHTMGIHHSWSLLLWHSTQALVLLAAQLGLSPS